jgi:RimJ/RimL family protein N-acetyltransferase
MTTPEAAAGLTWEHLAVELRTRRLTLRPFRADDVGAFAAFALDDAYRRFLGDHPDPAQFVANNVEHDGAWVIEHDGRVIGSVFLGDELACLLDPAVHRRGIGAEAAGAVISDAFERRGYTEIVAHADPANVASVRGLARLGFTQTGDGSYRLARDVWQSSGDRFQ